MSKTLTKPKAAPPAKGAGQAAILAAYRIELNPVAKGRLREIEEGRAALEGLAADAEGITITSEETNARAAQAVVDLAKGGKFMEELRGFFKKPLLAAGKAVDASFAEWVAAAGTQESRLRRELGAWFIQQRDKAAAAEEKRQADLAKDQARARGLGRPVPAAPPAAAAPAPTTRVDGGSLNVGTEWVYDLNQVNVEEVPRQYLMVNPRAVNAAIAGGVRKIPGLVIKEVPRTTAR